MRAEFRLIAVVALVKLIVQAGDGVIPVSPSRQAPDPNFIPIAVWYGARPHARADQDLGGGWQKK